MDIELELVRGANSIYKAIRSKHYVADNGSIGRQLRYLIHYKGQIAGIIAGGMSSLAGKARDEFFGLNLARQYDEYFADEHEGMQPMATFLRNVCIINNTVFRLTLNEHGLASKVLAAWRTRVVEDWSCLYADQIGSPAGLLPLAILGFETYIVPHDHGNGKQRNGACYRFDDWKYVGETTTGKLLYCRKNEEWKELYDGEECLIDWQIAELLEMMYRKGKK